MYPGGGPVQHVPGREEGARVLRVVLLLRDLEIKARRYPLNHPGAESDEGGTERLTEGETGVCQHESRTEE